jgi:hypothetical protein
MLPDFIISLVAISKDVGNILICHAGIDTYSIVEVATTRHTLPLALSSGVKWLIGGPGSVIFRSMPLRPSKKMALSAKYGFMSAPGTRISSRVADGGTEGGEMILIDAARES